MSPRHHPPLALLGDQAAGQLPEGLALVVAAHVEQCGLCRREQDLMEELGGALMADLAPEPLDEAVLAGVMDRLDELLPPPAPLPPLPAFLAPLPLPSALLPYLRGARRWSLLLPGISEVALPVSLNGLRCSLLRFQPGTVLPEHGHGGLELSLVLDGGFDSRAPSGTELFLPGDLSLKEPGEVHEVTIHEEGCLVLFARTGRLEPRTVKGALGMLLGRL